MYPDDTSISFSAKSITIINKLVNEDLGSLKTWLAANKLSLNIAKIESMVIVSGQKSKNISQTTAVKPSLEIDRETISMSEDTKYFGIYVHQHTNWGVKITNMIKKISKALDMLRYSKQYLQIKSAQTIYKSLVEPYF